MNGLQIFNNAEFGEIRSMSIDGDAWFMGKDVCEAFGDKNHTRTMGRLDEEDKKLIEIVDSLGRAQVATFVNESGLFSMLFAMQPQKANRDTSLDAYPIEVQKRIEKLHRFKRWVTHEVLPSLYRTGRYEMEQAKQQRLKDEAENVLDQVTPENWRYIKEGLAQRFDMSNLLLPSSAQNLTATLIVEDEKDRWAIDQALKAYGTVYEYYRTTHDDIKVKDLANLPGYQWITTVGSAILCSAQFLGRKARFKWNPDDPHMIFNCSSLRKDGRVTIPKIGAFAMDRKIMLPTGKQLSMAIVAKEPDGSYSIQFKCK